MTVHALREETLSPATIQRYVARAQKGDRNALGKVLEFYRLPITRYIARIVYDQQIARDLYQETCVLAQKKLHQYAPTNFFRAWLYAVARNVAVDHIRKMKRRPGAQIQEIKDGLPALTGNPEDERAAQALRRLIAAAVAKIPVHFQTMFLMYEEDGMSYQEIADCLEVPTSTVKAGLHHARVKLCRHLLEACPSILEDRGLTPTRRLQG